MRTLRAERPAGRDPAPSRLAYRAQRLYLTPLFRLFLRTGLPAGAALLLGMALFSDVERRQSMADWVDEIQRSVQNRPEFMVHAMVIEGASAELTQDIREILPVDFPVSSFDLDLPVMQKSVAGLDPVAAAALQIVTGGVLQVSVVERLPLVVWRERDGIELLDGDGFRVTAVAARVDRPDLPLIAGEGANQAVPEALAIMAAAGPVRPRLRGLTRVGNRRWDLVLDRDQRILLPESDPIPALEQVLALDRAQDILARDIVHVDMRNPVRPTILLAAPATGELRHIRDIEQTRASQ